MNTITTTDATSTTTSAPVDQKRALQERVNANSRLRSVLRGLAGWAGRTMPVVVVDDPEQPEPAAAGDSWHFETRGGRRINHPSAYSKLGWSNMVYCCSDRRVEVDADWLAERLEQLTRVVHAYRVAGLDRIGPRGDDDRVSVFAPHEVYRDMARNAVMITSRPGRYGVEWWLDSTIIQVVVRDSTTGLRHHLTVPPRFARPLEPGETPQDRIQAAIAWTFDLEPREYAPTVEA
jgi:hypothetical protein